MFRGLHYDEILMYWNGNFEVNFGKATYESCKAKFILVISSTFLYNRGKPLRPSMCWPVAGPSEIVLTATQQFGI